MAATPDLGTPSVSIVDDDASVRRALVRLLEAAGWNVEAFSSAEEFLDRLPGAASGCVVLDVNMPGMSGPQLHDLLVARGLTFPVVFLTERADVPTGVKAMKMGAIDYLLKPVDSAVLLAAVTDALSRHDAARARERDCEEVIARLRGLSRREREVMDHVIRGRLNKQIAADLGIAIQTVKVHRGRVMGKMKVRSVAQLVYACELAGVGR